MEIYLFLIVGFCIIAIRVTWVSGCHNTNELRKSHYVFKSKDFTIGRRKKKDRLLDYFKIWIWRESSFMKKEMKVKLKNWKV